MLEQVPLLPGSKCSRGWGVEWSREGSIWPKAGWGSSSFLPGLETELIVYRQKKATLNSLGLSPRATQGKNGVATGKVISLPSGLPSLHVSSDSTSLYGRYDPDHVCNASDNAGRYTYSKQPQVCKWNLQKLAEALEPELPLVLAEAILKEEFDSEFQRHYLQKMRKKLGLIRVEKEEDGTLVAKLLETMHLTGEPQNPATVGKYFV